ncbi:MAG TPA: family 16 glycoside hydrolase, partial [Isosphaeraceae bacterium]|nr:family 16 glycoside hydrolase [Isosphaeraceae bacterium]
NVAGSIRDVPGALSFVRNCRDPESGGFAPTPGGKPDVATTASGLMALAEFRVPTAEPAEAALKYFKENADTFDEVRIAVAGLEAVKVKPPADVVASWTKIVNADRNGDGTWGQGGAKARATGGAAVALLRMGVELDHIDAILAALREGQRPDGGWSPDGNRSNLEASYRIMRCVFMLKGQPDLPALQKFLASCRNSDGGFGTTPGQPSSLGGTYFATTILRWTRLLTGEPAVVETAGFTPLFDGKSLAGWEGNAELWSARDGMIVGKSPGIKRNEFLANEAIHGDFVLKLTFRMIGGPESNSGVMFRSVRVPGTEMSGYQADVGQGYWGCLYDESRRNKVLVPASERAVAKINKNGWNTYVIRAVGDHVTLSLNGVPSVDYHEPDPAIARDGRIAVQIHAGGPMEVQFKDIYIQKIPSSKADDAATPGFHLRTVKAPDGERKYTVYLPEGYDGSKAFPVVLFLHGAGERGKDGMMCTYAGLGPNLLAHPGQYPFIVVFPQAERRWDAGSPDADAALAALDDVLNTFKADKNHVVLTGLSLGGHGSWQLAAAHPERFVAVAPVCGFDDPKAIAPKVKGLPIWTFLGDADGAMIVDSTRAMDAALRDLGAHPRETEYRSVGHNSWDRAYSDPALARWMLDPKRGE